MKTPAITTIGVLVLLTVSRATMSAPELTQDLFSRSSIMEVMQRVFDWQMRNPVSINDRNENDWARAAFYAGVMAAYRTTHDEQYLDAAIAWSRSCDWKLAKRTRHADDQARGQTFLEIYEVKKDPSMIGAIRDRYDSLIADPKPGREDWWWCDALFMAPPVLARLAAATGDRKYLTYLDAMFWDTFEFLYDKHEHLFYRDQSYFDRKSANGRKTFWARGNGWVMAGTVRVLQYLPKNDPSYSRYVSLLKDMAAAVERVQGEDGLWRPSLLDQNEIPQPETSGSAFFCYAIAWGINNNLLSRTKCLPCVQNAWRGLRSHVTREGRLQWVQPIGAAPDKVTADDSQEYGSGGFLLAGSEVCKLGL